MARVAELLVNIRDRLSDPKKERWEDDHLLRLISKQQKTIAVYSKLLITEIEVELLMGQNVYSMPDDSYRVLRILGVDNQVLPVYSHNKIDTHVAKVRQQSGFNSIASWEADKAEKPTAVIFDKLTPNTFKVYPEPFIAISSDKIVGNFDIYGILTGSSDERYGTFVGYEEVEVAGDGDRPVVGKLKVYYTREPKSIVSTEDKLEVPSIFDVVLEYQVVALAFRDNKDTLNMQLSTDFMRLAEVELKKLTEDKADSYQQASTSDVVGNYYNGFN